MAVPVGAGIHSDDQRVPSGGHDRYAQVSSRFPTEGKDYLPSSRSFFLAMAPCTCTIHPPATSSSFSTPYPNVQLGSKGPQPHAGTYVPVVKFLRQLTPVSAHPVGASVLLVATTLSVPVTNRITVFTVTDDTVQAEFGLWGAYYRNLRYVWSE